MDPAGVTKAMTKESTLRVFRHMRSRAISSSVRIPTARLRARSTGSAAYHRSRRGVSWVLPRAPATSFRTTGGARAAFAGNGRARWVRRAAHPIRIMRTAGICWGLRGSVRSSMTWDIAWWTVAPTGSPTVRMRTWSIRRVRVLGATPSACNRNRERPHSIGSAQWGTKSAPRRAHPIASMISIASSQYGLSSSALSSASRAWGMSPWARWMAPR
jgi:hypothetical protein